MKWYLRITAALVLYMVWDTLPPYYPDCRYAQEQGCREKPSGWQPWPEGHISEFTHQYVSK